MIENLFSIPMLIIYAIAYGITMKVADLLNEYGLKWFKGSAIIFGFLWGIFGVMLVVGDNTIANIMLAMNIAFIIRNRLDYINHRIASSVIIIVFLFTSTFSPVLFLAFYFAFLIFGSIKDHVDDILKKEKWNICFTQRSNVILSRSNFYLLRDLRKLDCILGVPFLYNCIRFN